jgi:hypothetical protein
MIPAFERLTGVIPLIEQGQYYVIHAALQSGKTTFLWDLEQKLNGEGKYYALYCSLESVQNIKDPEKGLPAVVDCIKKALMQSSIPQHEKFAADADYSDFTNVLRDELTSFCGQLDKPLVIFFDEADCLSGKTIIEFLQQLRDGYNSRTTTPFVHSVAFTGMRNIRNFKEFLDSEISDNPNPLDIINETLTIKNFTREQITALYNQHTQETGQTFENDTINIVYQQTQGQPWLVNAIAREVIVKMLNDDYTKPVTAPLVEQAIQTIILSRNRHIDRLSELLKEERVKSIIEPLIMGETVKSSTFYDDYLYTQALGLVRSTKGVGVEPANPIYAEMIIRALTRDIQEAINNEYFEHQISRRYKNR